MALVTHRGYLLELVLEVDQDGAIRVHLIRGHVFDPLSELAGYRLSTLYILELLLSRLACQERWQDLSRQSLEHVQDELEIVVKGQRFANHNTESI